MDLKLLLWNVARKSAAVLVCAYIAALAALYLRQDSMLFPRPAQRGAVPALPGLAEVTVETPDGERLHGWHVPPAPGKPSVLFFHGNGDRVNGFGFLAAQFSKAGIGFTAIEYRGYPGSTGKPSETGLMTDGLAAFDWLKGQCGCDIVVMAHSLGTGVAVNTAAEREARAVALFASYSAVADVAADRYWFFPVRQLIENPIHSDRRIGRVSEPMLFVHGTADRTIPLQFGRKLFDLANEPKRFVAIEGAGHSGIVRQGAVEKVLELIGE